METELDQSRVDARESLFDAVAALESHGDATILARAQAVDHP